VGRFGAWGVSATRVVLVKPGDVLIFGNVGDAASGDWSGVESLKELLGLKAIVVFDEDIDLAAVPGGDGT